MLTRKVHHLTQNILDDEKRMAEAEAKPSRETAHAHNMKVASVIPFILFLRLFAAVKEVELAKDDEDRHETHLMLLMGKFDSILQTLHAIFDALDPEDVFTTVVNKFIGETTKGEAAYKGQVEEIVNLINQIPDDE